MQEYFWYLHIDFIFQQVYWTLFSFDFLWIWLDVLCEHSNKLLQIMNSVSSFSMNILFTLC